MCGYGFWAGLYNVELMVQAILGPLNVHWPWHTSFGAVVLFNGHCLPGQSQHFFVGQAEGVAFFFRHRNCLDAFVGIVTVNHLDFLASLEPAQDRAITFFIGRFMDEKLIGINRTLHDRLAQAIGAGNKNNVTETRFGIQGKHDATGCQIGAHHFHDRDRQSHFEMIEVPINTVMDGAIVEKTGKTQAAGFD